MEKYGDMKLPELRHVLANCPEAKSFSLHDRCRVRYGEDSGLALIANGHRLSPRPLVGFGRRRGFRFKSADFCRFVRGRDWLKLRLHLRQGRLQRIQARGVRKLVVFDGAPDRRSNSGQLVVGEVNCQHGPPLGKARAVCDPGRFFEPPGERGEAFVLGYR
jgi:hypothetical protein